MSELELVRKSFIAFLDGLWWGLRDTVGALSMHEGYARGFRQIGIEAAERSSPRGPEAAAKTAAELMRALGLDARQEGHKITVHSCPLTDRIIERGLEYAFRIDEICWLPMMQAIGERAGAVPSCKHSLSSLYLERQRLDYKIEKAKASFEAGKLSRDEFEREMSGLEKAKNGLPDHGEYVFERP
ncbi:MAG: hypothetical protein QXS20_03495 [Candidatus Thorarchaeota archaeon]